MSALAPGSRHIRHDGSRAGAPDDLETKGHLMFAPHAVEGRRLVTLLLASVALASCGDDGPTGPSPNFSLLGSWNWEMTNATNGPHTCSVTEVALIFIEEEGEIIGGVLGSGDDNIRCSTNGVPGSPADFSLNSDLRNFSLNGSAIGYSFATNQGDWVMTGTVTGDDTMSGTGTIRLTSGGTTLTFTGPWTATRI